MKDLTRACIDVYKEYLKEEMGIMTTIKTTKLANFEQILRNKLVLQGRVMIRRGSGRRSISWLQNVSSQFEISTKGIFRVFHNTTQQQSDRQGPIPTSTRRIHKTVLL